MEQIDKGLHYLDLNITIIIVSINKTKSHGIVACENIFKELMPISVTCINIEFNFNPTINNFWYYKDRKFAVIND